MQSPTVSWGARPRCALPLLVRLPAADWEPGSQLEKGASPRAQAAQLHTHFRLLGSPKPLPAAAQAQGPRRQCRTQAYSTIGLHIRKRNSTPHPGSLLAVLTESARCLRGQLLSGQPRVPYARVNRSRRSQAPAHMPLPKGCSGSPRVDIHALVYGTTPPPAAGQTPRTRGQPAAQWRGMASPAHHPATQ